MWRQNPEDLPKPGLVPAPDPVQPILARHAETAAPARPLTAPASHARIGKGITVRGEISGVDSLSVEGTVEGTICIPGERVTVGRDGRVVAPEAAAPAACIRAREIVLLGNVTGHIEAQDRVDIRATASLSGDVSTRRVSIEDGAYFRGGIDILRDQPSAAPAAVPVGAAPEPEPVHPAAPVHI